MRILEKLNQVNRINWVIKIFLQELSGSNWINEETNSECNLNGPRILFWSTAQGLLQGFWLDFPISPRYYLGLIQNIPPMSLSLLKRELKAIKAHRVTRRVHRPKKI